MADQFLAEIRIFAGNFAPTGWALCDGQLMPISQNTALFSLIGTYYGGDGRSTFALPNLQGSVPLGTGQGPGLSLRDIGETGGEQTVTLLDTEMPQHTHTVQASTNGGTDSPANAFWGESKLGKTPLPVYAASGPNNINMSPNAISIAGSSFPHNNLPPYLCLTFIIALQGIFPPRS
ncbi:MAG TPA: tail fiber protein [Candidatus Binatia bacterium]|jgi:microcystin-dependent protein|nr:tail fiber protein [Candidatus Binatia bacterium]